MEEETIEAIYPRAKKTGAITHVKANVFKVVYLKRIPKKYLKD